MEKRSHIRQLRQDKADTDAATAKLRVEGQALLSIAARSTTEEARLVAVEKQMSTLATAAVAITQDLARAERFADDERAAAAAEFAGEDTPATPAFPTGPKWARMFPGLAADLGGWGKDVRSASREFFQAVGRGLHDERLQAGMTEGSGSGGGFAVPAGVIGPWLDSSLESEIVRSRATVWPMVSDARAVPAWDLMNRSNDVGGLAIQWLGEGAPIDYQVGKVRLVRLKARKGAILLEASNELLSDGMDMASQINTGLVLSTGYGLDQSFFFGAGNSQPMGILNAACKATIGVSKENGQAANTITYNNLVAMFSRLTPASVGNSVWVAHPSTIPQLTVLSVLIGTAGTHVPVMTSNSGQFTILTRPVIFSEKVKPLGSRGDIVLADFSQYVIGMRQEATIDRSAHVGFTRDMETFRLVLRVDGQPNISAPYQPPNSAPTLSPFVTLEARS